MSPEYKIHNAAVKTSRRAALCVAAVAVCVVAAGVWLGCGGLWGGFDGLVRALGSGRFRLFLYISGGCVMALAVLAGVLVRAGAPPRRRLGAQDGTAIIEFALVLPIALMIALMMLQSSLLMGGYLCVNYASFAAARAASVQVPRDLEDEEANVVADLSDPELSEKMWHIHMAAVWATMPAADGAFDGDSPYGAVLQEGLADFLSRHGRSANWTSTLIGKKLAYAQQNTWVSLQPPINGDSFGEHEDLHVTVKHNLYLSIPYANWILAKLDSAGVDFGEGRYAVTVEIPCTLTNEGKQDYIDVERFPD
jgi:hypothetical protein